MSISSASSASTTTNATSAHSRVKATGVNEDATNENVINSIHQKSLANRVRGIGKRISRFRSRSAERVSQRNRSSPQRRETTEDDMKKQDTVSVAYPSGRQDKTSGNHTIITFR